MIDLMIGGTMITPIISPATQIVIQEETIQPISGKAVILLEKFLSDPGSVKFMD
jgi:hypothetical protein